MKKIIMVLIAVVLVGCSSKQGRALFIKNSSYGFESVYMLEGTTKDFIAIKNGKVYHIISRYIDANSMTRIIELTPLGLITTTEIPVIRKQGE